MRYLCVCEGGNVRSGNLATILKDQGHDALQVGILWNNPETVAMLCEWAEVIFVAEARLMTHLPEQHRDKVSLEMCVGPDRWGMQFHDELAMTYLTRLPLAGIERGPRLKNGETPFVRLK